MGALTGKYGPQNPPPLQRRSRLSGLLGRVDPLLEVLGRVGAEQGGKTSAQVALNWTICKGTLPIPGAKNERQAAENAGALGWRLHTGRIERLHLASRFLSTSALPDIGAYSPRAMYLF